MGHIVSRLGNLLKIGQFSVDTSAYFYVSQIYRKQNRTRKQSRSVQCGQAVRSSLLQEIIFLRVSVV